MNTRRTFFNVTALALIYDKIEKESIGEKSSYDPNNITDRTNARTTFMRKALSKKILDKALKEYFEVIREEIAENFRVLP